jgi:hypothetical protein
MTRCIAEARQLRVLQIVEKRMRRRPAGIAVL